MLGLLFCHVLSDIFVLIQCFRQLDQLHEFTPVTMWVKTPGLAGKPCDVVVAKGLEVRATPQFLPKGSDGCRKIETVTTTGIDAAIHDR